VSETDEVRRRQESVCLGVLVTKLTPLYDVKIHTCLLIFVLSGGQSHELESMTPLPSCHVCLLIGGIAQLPYKRTACEIADASSMCVPPRHQTQSIVASFGTTDCIDCGPVVVVSVRLLPQFISCWSRSLIHFLLSIQKMMISKSLLLAFLATASPAAEAFVPLAPRSRVACPLALGYSRYDHYDTPLAPPREEFMDEALPPPPRDAPLPRRYPDPDPYYEGEEVYPEPPPPPPHSYASRDYGEYYPPRNNNHNEYYDDGPRTSNQANNFYEPSRRSSSSWDTTYVDDTTNTFRPTMPLTEDPESFYENRSYDAPLRGDRWADSIHRRKIMDRDSDHFNYNYNNPRGETLNRRLRRRTWNSMQSDSIPGRDMTYADSKEQFLSNRREDLWSRFFTSGRHAMDNFRNEYFPGAAMSQDLKDTVRDQQHILQPLLQEALICLENDPVCREVLGPDIRLDQPFSQSQSSSSRNGLREPARVELQLRAHGRRGIGMLDISATDMGITELILTTPSGPRGEPRRIHVNLGVSMKPGIDIVDRSSPRDRGEGYVNPFLPSSVMPDVMDAEFEVLDAQNQTTW
jgi:hypothetical protein